MNNLVPLCLELVVLFSRYCSLTGLIISTTKLPQTGHYQTTWRSQPIQATSTTKVLKIDEPESHTVPNDGTAISDSTPYSTLHTTEALSNTWTVDNQTTGLLYETSEEPPTTTENVVTNTSFPENSTIRVPLDTSTSSSNTTDAPLNISDSTPDSTDYPLDTSENTSVNIPTTPWSPQQDPTAVTTSVNPNPTGSTPKPADDSVTLVYEVIAAVCFCLIVIFGVLFAISVYLYRYNVDARTFCHALRHNCKDVVVCKYRMPGRDPESGIRGNDTLSKIRPSGQNTPGQGSTIIPTESMVDLSKLGSEGDEEFSEEEEELENLDLPTSPIPIQTFVASYGADDIDKDKLKGEFDLVVAWSKQLSYKKVHAKLERNRLRNRYYDIIPFDYNRVPLYDIPDTRGCEVYEQMTTKDKKKTRFINASYIHKFGSDKAKYIATQGPTGITIHDFWEMVWQEDSDIIVMLTSLREQGKVKCEQYWPSSTNETIQCRDVNVRLEVTQGYAYYNYMSIILTKNALSRRVHHYMYHHWPDKEAPEMALPILDLYRKVFARETRGPVIVHCSAGVGRTGTFISLDYLLEQANETNAVDVMACLQELRHQRVCMIQKLTQYEFLYEALHEALDIGCTATPTARFKDWFRIAENDEDFPILKKFELMCSKKPDRRVAECEGLLPENKDKNRDADIIPDDVKRPFLFTFLKGRNTYINAVYVDTFLESKGVIATQLPLSSTICDFWRLVYDRNCTTIILLDDMVDLPEDCPIYWPEDGKEMTFGDTLSVSGTYNEKLSTKIFTVRDFQVVMKQEENYIISVKMLQLKTWGRAATLPANMLDLSDLMKAAQKMTEHTTIVQCIDGCERSGIFCACMHIVDQIQIDHDVDIYHACRIITSSRPQFLQVKDQYKFLHEFAIEYLHTFDEYSNFSDALDSYRASMRMLNVSRSDDKSKCAEGENVASADSANGDHNTVNRAEAACSLQGNDNGDSQGHDEVELQILKQKGGQDLPSGSASGKDNNDSVSEENVISTPPQVNSLLREKKHVDRGTSSGDRFSLDNPAPVKPPKPCRIKSTFQ